MFTSFQKNVQEKKFTPSEGLHVMREQVHLVQKKSSCAIAKKKVHLKKVHFMFGLKVHMSCARRFTWYKKNSCAITKKVHLVPKKIQEKSSIHVPSEDSHEVTLRFI